MVGGGGILRSHRYVIPTSFFVILIVLHATSASQSAATFTVSKSVIGPGEHATIDIYPEPWQNPKPNEIEIIVIHGTLSPVTRVGTGHYQATLTYDGPGSTLIAVRLYPHSQMEQIGTVHFGGASTGGALNITASKSTNSVDLSNGTWMSVVDDGITISGTGAGETIDQVKVTISSGFNPQQDQLGLWINGEFVQTHAQDNITVSYGDGTLMLSGVAPIETYNALLRQVAYRTTHQHPDETPRTIDFVIGDVDPDAFTYNPVTGHYYEYVHDPGTWMSAHKKAAQRQLFGMQGYLATITSANENELVKDIASTNAWIGASSNFNLWDGYHWWVTGPETGMIISEWKHSVQGAYVNWADWNQHSGEDRRDFVYMNHESGQWVNPRNTESVQVPGYIVEYGGFPGDSGHVKLVDSVVINFPEIPPPPPFDPSKSGLSVHPSMVHANGVDAATVTVTLKDQDGDPYVAIPPSIRVRNAQVGPVTHQGGGVYIASVTSNIPGTSQIVVEISGQEVLRDGLITFRNNQIDDDEPLLSVSKSKANFDYGGWVVIDDALAIEGMKPGSTLQGAKVEITDGFDASVDALGFVVNGQWHSTYSASGITATYDPATGTMTFDGNATWIDYRTALRSVVYRNVGSPSSSETRRIVFSIVKEMPNRLIGYDHVSDHYYEYVEHPQITWMDAEIAAASRSLYGRQGYLATITSQEENDYISNFTPKSAWIGGSDEEQPETWRWVTGPETGQVFWQGLANGTGVWGVYANWGSDEPNHYQTNWGTEHWVQIFGQDAPQKLDGVLPSDIGKWNDLSYFHDTWVDGYIIEYGGMMGDSVEIRFSDSLLVEFAVAQPPVANFSWTPKFPRFGDEISFEDLSTQQGGGTLSYQWTFGDGASSTDQHPTHTYAQLGDYAVTLTVTNEADLSHTTSKTIKVTADLYGYVFNDDNRSGIKDFDESGLGLSNLFVTVVRNGVVVASAPSSEAGHTFDRLTGEYNIRGLEAGSYQVMVTHQGSQTPVTPEGWSYTSGGASPLVSVTLGALQTLTPGTKRGPDFGFAQGLLIKGTVFRDDGGTIGSPNDGQQTGDEAGVGGLRLRVLGESGQPLATGLTNAQGQYEFVVPWSSAEQDPPTVRLVLNNTDLRATGYRPGTGSAPVQLTSFHDMVDVALQLQSEVHTYDGFDFGVVSSMALNAFANGYAARGGFVVYPFSMRIGTVGALTFDITTPRSWDYSVYVDHNGNGQLDHDDPILGETITVGPGDKAFLLVVRVPTWEQDGAVDSARINVTFTYEGNTALLETDHFFSFTTVNSSRLELQAGVRNVTAEDPPGGGFTNSQVEAESGDVLEYRMVYKNNGVTSVRDVVVTAAIPQGTQLDLDAYGHGQYVAWIQGDGHVSSGPGGITVSLGDLLPNESGAFKYRVILK